MPIDPTTQGAFSLFILVTPFCDSDKPDSLSLVYVFIY